MHGSRDEDSSRVGRLLADVQRDLDRVEPEDLAAEVAAGALIVDIRPAENRGSEGVLPGALVVDRTRAGVAGSTRPAPTGCRRRTTRTGGWSWSATRGYASSLAAHTLRVIGLTRATDLVGGCSPDRTTGPRRSA